MIKRRDSHDKMLVRRPSDGGVVNAPMQPQVGKA